jgi:hypothetical protein
VIMNPAHVFPFYSIEHEAHGIGRRRHNGRRSQVQFGGKTRWVNENENANDD